LADLEPAVVGVAVPGHIDRATGRTVLVPNLAGDWHDFPLAAELGTRLGVPIGVINDARAFATAESCIGAAAGVDRALFATLGTGIGGAVLLDGQILHNASDSVGEFGHCTVVAGGELCGCGNRGCAEAYAGARSMSQRYRARRGAGGSRLGAIDALRRDFEAGDPDAVEIVEMATWALGCAITNIAVTLRIPTVVLGGGVAIRWPEFAVQTQRQLVERAVLLGPCAVHVSALGDSAGAVGAAIRVIGARRKGGVFPEMETGS